MSIPHNHGREIPLEEKKVLQLDILSAIDEFCRDNNLRYSMGCGTMLGAVRHKGYIPWDDDIDIYMLREDYNKLMKIFPDNYQNRYCLKSLERSKDWDFAYAKAYDNRTVVYEFASYNELFGVNIDIFPIDDVPNDEQTWLEYDKKRRELLKYRRFLFKPADFSLKPRDFFKWLYYKTWNLICSRRSVAEQIDKFAQKWNGKGYDYVFECCMGRIQKHKFEKGIFDDLIMYPFEDRFYMGFANYDEYLRNGYGDYMKLPPEEKRITHHINNSFWK